MRMPAVPQAVGATERLVVSIGTWFGVRYAPNWADNKLKFKLDIFNIFNNDEVTEYDEFKESARDVISADDLNDVNYQTPRSARFNVRYDF